MFDQEEDEASPPTDELVRTWQRLDAKIPAPHYDEEKYKKELEDLKALQVTLACSFVYTRVFLRLHVCTHKYACVLLSRAVWI